VFFSVTFVTFVVVNFRKLQANVVPNPIQNFEETDNFCTNPIEVDSVTGEVTCEPFNLYVRFHDYPATIGQRPGRS